MSTQEHPLITYMNSEEQLNIIAKETAENRERVVALETKQQIDILSTSNLALRIDILTKTINDLALKINTIEAQRNTVIGIAGVIGSVIGFLANFVFNLMTSNQR